MENQKYFQIQRIKNLTTLFTLHAILCMSVCLSSCLCCPRVSSSPPSAVSHSSSEFNETQDDSVVSLHRQNKQHYTFLFAHDECPVYTLLFEYDLLLFTHVKAVQV